MTSKHINSLIEVQNSIDSYIDLLDNRMNDL